MCQGEETWKGSKMTASASAKSWYRLERRIQASPVSMVCPKGHQEMLISCGENPSYSIRDWHHAQGQTAFARLQAEQGVFRLGMEIPTIQPQKNTCFCALFILTLLLLLLFHSFDTVTSSLRLISHTSKQSPGPSDRVQFQQLGWLMCLKTFVFPVSVGAARNFLRLSCRLVIKTAQWFFVKNLLLRFSSGEQ